MGDGAEYFDFALHVVDLFWFQYLHFLQYFGSIEFGRNFVPHQADSPECPYAEGR